MSLSSLSQEMIDEIIDILYASDPDSSHFSSHSLVCQSFRHRTQQHLFRFISYHFYKNDSSCLPKLQDRRQMLEKNPKIAGYVRHLHFVITGDTLWTFDHPEFIRMMEIIAQASAQRIDAPLQVLISGGENPKIPDDFAQHIFEEIGPYVETLKLHTIEFMPCRWIADCRNLLKLEMVRVSIAKNDTESTRSRLPRPQELILYWPYWPDDSSAAVDYLIKFALDPSGLHSFQTQFSGNLCLDDIVSIIKACSSSLEFLGLWDEQGSALADLFNLSELPNLKVLFLKVDISPDDDDGDDDDDDNDDDALEDLCALLNTASKDSKIDDILLEIQCESHPDVGPLAHLEMSNWRMLDSTLVKLSGGRRLKLDIRIYYHFEEEPDMSDSEADPADRIEAWIAEQLPVTSRQSHIALHSEYHGV
ncbi:hypothetical protein CPB84DRAFT_1850834 [Gymnopilus junonius]|uniref:Uncharacterized protein n=1 Tax=Gymnopilus junonius TaxID=109634 RepID=A0A9P5NDK4_GYMJU|nr:hypothetical protein CPB84DRAFT_1850834 [Gymnopilus junonius]